MPNCLHQSGTDNNEKTTFFNYTITMTFELEALKGSSKYTLIKNLYISKFYLFLCIYLI